MFYKTYKNTWKLKNYKKKCIEMARTKIPIKIAIITETCNEWLNISQNETIVKKSKQS